MRCADGTSCCGSRAPLHACLSQCSVATACRSLGRPLVQWAHCSLLTQLVSALKREPNSLHLSPLSRASLLPVFTSYGQRIPEPSRPRAKRRATGSRAGRRDPFCSWFRLLLALFRVWGGVAVWKKAVGLRVHFLLPQVFLEDSELLCDTRINDFCVEHIKARQRFNRVTA